MRRLFLHIIIFFLITIPLRGWGQEPIYQFESFNTKDGLPSEDIRWLLQDQTGYLWISTRNGLSRYDGSKFINYLTNPKDSTSISSNNSIIIYEDRKGKIWIGGTQGLDCYDPKTDRFSHFTNQPDHPGSISHNDIRGILEDRAGNLWIGTFGGGLNRFDPAKGTFQHFLKDPSNPNSLTHNNINQLLLDHEGLIWIATDAGGVSRFDPVHNQFTNYVVNDLDPGSLNQNTVDFIYEDHKGRIWVNTLNKKLDLFDRNTGKFTHIPNLFDNQKPYSTLFLCEDLQGRLFAKTNQGFAMFDPVANKFHKPMPDNFIPDVMKKNGIGKIIKDQSGIIWLASQNGLIKYNPATLNFGGYVIRDPNTQQKSEIFSFCQLHNGMVLVGCVNQILQYNPETKQFKPFLSNIFPASERLKKVAYSIVEDRDGIIWMGFPFGLIRYNPSNNTVTQFQNNPNDPSSLPNNSVRKLFEDRDGRLWVGTPNGLSLMDKARGTFQHFRQDKNQAQSISNSTIFSMYQSRNGDLWIGTSNGLNRLPYAEIERGGNSLKPDLPFEHFIHDPDNPASISSNSIWQIFEDQRGYIWLGTNGGGLCRMDPKTKTFKTYSEQNGLTDKQVWGILADSEGFLWISTNNGGLLKFDAQKEQFTSYRDRDGLQSNYFNSGAQLIDRNGTLYFGGEQGFNIFNPQQIKKNELRPKVVITDFELLGQRVAPTDSLSPIPYNIAKTDTLYLKYNQNTFGFKFSAMDFTAPEKNKFLYRFLPIITEWTPAGANQMAHFANLSPGKYTLLVKGSNSDGVWNDKITTLHIIIQKPFYLTWWAYLIYIFIAYFSIRALVNARVKYLNQRAEELENTVRKRTAEVHQQREQLQLQKNDLQKLTDELQEMDRLKSNFFANVSHELRTPLTLILGPLNAILKRGDYSSKGYIDLRLMQKNGSQLLKLINELLDLSKLESNRMYLKEEAVVLYDVLRRIITNFESNAQYRKILLSFDYDFDKQMKIMLDEPKFEKILNNLLSNALKFTPDGGTIALSAKDINTHIQLSVRDNGVGIAREDLPYIFDRFYQSAKSDRNQNPGTGIGLALAKEMAGLMQGKLTVESEPGKGSAFTLLFPKKEAFGMVESKNVRAEEPVAALALEKDISPPTNGTNAEKEGRILLVEDNSDMRQFVRSLLSSRFEIIQATNGLEALALLEGNPTDSSGAPLPLLPDLIISDVMMPYMDGFSLLERIKDREIWRLIPVILLTARAEKDDKMHALRIGVDDYILKPFDSDELIVRVENLLENYRTRKAALPVESEIENTSSSIATMHKADLEWLAALEAFVREKSKNPDYTTYQLADHLALSERQLQRKLKELTGLTPNQYLRDIRLQHARELLETQTFRTVSEVCFAVGYTTPDYFTKLYKERFGKNPSDFL